MAGRSIQLENATPIGVHHGHVAYQVWGFLVPSLPLLPLSCRILVTKLGQGAVFALRHAPPAAMLVATGEDVGHAPVEAGHHHVEHIAKQLMGLLDGVWVGAVGTSDPRQQCVTGKTG